MSDRLQRPARETMLSSPCCPTLSHNQLPLSLICTPESSTHHVLPSHTAPPLCRIPRSGSVWSSSTIAAADRPEARSLLRSMSRFLLMRGARLQVDGGRPDVREGCVSERRAREGKGKGERRAREGGSEGGGRQAVIVKFKPSTLLSGCRNESVLHFVSRFLTHSHTEQRGTGT